MCSCLKIEFYLRYPHTVEPVWDEGKPGGLHCHLPTLYLAGRAPILWCTGRNPGKSGPKVKLTFGAYPQDHAFSKTIKGPLRNLTSQHNRDSVVVTPPDSQHPGERPVLRNLKKGKWQVFVGISDN